MHFASLWVRGQTFCDWRGEEKAEIRQRLRGEPTLPILPLEEALSSTAPALLLIPAKDHGDKPRSRTSNKTKQTAEPFCCH